MDVKFFNEIISCFSTNNQLTNEDDSFIKSLILNNCSDDLSNISLEHILKKTNSKNLANFAMNILNSAIQNQKAKFKFKKAPKILVVDDEESICEYLEVLFEDYGFKSQYTTKPNEVLRLIKENDFDIVLSDIRMPKMDGVEVFSQVKKEINRPPDFIFMTADSQYTKEQLLGMGAKEMLSKPFRHQYLYQTIIKSHIESPFDNQRHYRAQISLEIASQENTKINNLALGGVFLEIPEECIEESDKYTLKNQFPIVFSLIGDEINTNVEVIWRRTNKNSHLPSGIGLKFLDFPKKSYPKLLDYIQFHKSTQYFSS